MLLLNQFRSFFFHNSNLYSTIFTSAANWPLLPTTKFNKLISLKHSKSIAFYLPSNNTNISRKTLSILQSLEAYFLEPSFCQEFVDTSFYVADQMLYPGAEGVLNWIDLKMNFSELRYLSILSINVSFFCERYTSIMLSVLYYLLLDGMLEFTCSSCLANSLLKYWRPISTKLR